MAVGGNSKANQARSTKRKNNRGARRSYAIYRNEDRAWVSKLNRLGALLTHAKSPALKTERAKVYADVMSRAPAHIRLQFKAAA